MAEFNPEEFVEETPPDPEHLWIWDVDVYKDQDQRTWVPIVIKADKCRQVLWHQEDILVGEPLSPSQLTSYQLPWSWELQPGKQYLCSGAVYWRIVFHVKFRGLEEMLLEQLPSGN